MLIVYWLFYQFKVVMNDEIAAILCFAFVKIFFQSLLTTWAGSRPSFTDWL